DYRIKLEEGKTPPFRPIYISAKGRTLTPLRLLFATKSRAFIRNSISPAGAPVLFILKKGGKLYLYIDYKRLNKIIYKNRTPFPLIYKTLDSLS
ncbi:hypothetical protein ACRALDRAFT_2077596, partial [Sodiomyces alcalophilus JCM 7366]|uniref:uncharacterized protein n=1 Tax=Sodiomyces alcalophilus JCM 7366 TaxID=591952 RepID=UPI0039B52733